MCCRIAGVWRAPGPDHYVPASARAGQCPGGGPGAGCRRGCPLARGCRGVPGSGRVCAHGQPLPPSSDPRPYPAGVQRGHCGAAARLGHCGSGASRDAPPRPRYPPPSRAFVASEATPRPRPTEIRNGAHPAKPRPWPAQPRPQGARGAWAARLRPHPAKPRPVSIWPRPFRATDAPEHLLPRRFRLRPRPSKPRPVLRLTTPPACRGSAGATEISGPAKPRLPLAWPRPSGLQKRPGSETTPPERGPSPFGHALPRLRRRPDAETTLHPRGHASAAPSRLQRRRDAARRSRPLSEAPPRPGLQRRLNHRPPAFSPRNPAPTLPPGHAHPGSRGALTQAEATPSREATPRTRPPRAPPAS